jgi:hypothetical protein
MAKVWKNRTELGLLPFSSLPSPISLVVALHKRHYLLLTLR